ncbi:unnamed protein product [Gemmata massiliana]|uniref:Uncharacterized protein n=1 Tax=Gemmata massiliana TaxID=1210884 RepID=A0A6P2D6T0_9BACT|nr:hypothetical protein [Gemmata massiliana]VTR97021.1 unnamed protein product [Gemmata massiliana]
MSATVPNSAPRSKPPRALTSGEIGHLTSEQPEVATVDPTTWLALAREKVAARVAQDPEMAKTWRDMTPLAQERWIQRDAGERAIFSSGVGRAASRIYTAVTELHTALHDFQRKYPNATDITRATAAALQEAVLPSVPEDEAPDLSWLSNDVRGWAFVVGNMTDLLMGCKPPEALESVEKPMNH